MSQNPTVLILGGGFATRLWPLTEHRAKPLLPLAGKPLIQHMLEKIPQGIRVILSTNAKFKTDFLALLRAFPDRSVEIFIEDSAHDREKTGALASTALAIEHFQITTPLLLLAGDNYFGFSLESFIEAYQRTTLLAAYDTQSLEAARQFGVVSVSGSRLTGFQEKPGQPASTLVSTGCYLFSPSHLPLIQAFARVSNDNLGGIFEYLLKREEAIDVFSFTEPWLDIGSFESYLEAHRRLAPESRIARSAKIEGCRMGSAVSIGESTTIQNAELEDVLILDHCTIRDARLRGCIVDSGSTIVGVDLDHKMIRKNSVITADE